MSSPASTQHEVALRELAAGTVSTLSVRVDAVGRRSRSALFRSVSACALPRPSAIASAKFAKSTVNQSQNGDLPGEERLARCRSISSCTKMIVVIRLPTSTMNITGFLTWIRGSSLRNESTTACRMMAGSQIEIRARVLT